MQYGSIGGFTPESVAAKYGVTVDDLIAVNPQFSAVGGMVAGRSYDASFLMGNKGIQALYIPAQRAAAPAAAPMVMPTPAAASAPQPTQSYTPPPAPAAGVAAAAPVATTPPIIPVIAYQYKVNTPGSTLHVRSAPGTSTTIIDTLANGAYIKTGSPVVQKDGYSWLFVSYDSASGGKTGYVAGEYLTKL